MADHGEEFQDHGKWLHGRSVFDELVRIPLIVKFPASRDAGRRVAQQVQAVDVLPTVLEALGLPVPAPAGDRRPAAAGGDRGAARRSRPRVSEISHRGFVAHGMRTSATSTSSASAPQEDELYFDLAKDPKEQTSLVESQPSRVRVLKGRREAAMVPNPFRHIVRVAGAAEYALTLKTGGWIEGVETTGLGPGERSSSRATAASSSFPAPAPGPREIAFGLRPLGAPVWLEGTRDGRPLRPADVVYAESGRASPRPALPPPRHRF